MSSLTDGPGNTLLLVQAADPGLNHQKRRARRGDDVVPRPCRPIIAGIAIL